MTASVLDQADAPAREAAVRADLATVARLAAHVGGAAYAVLALGDGDAERPVAAHGSASSDAPLLVEAALAGSEGRAFGSLRLYGPGALGPDQRALVSDLAAHAATLVELRRSAEALTRAAGRDPLTGLANRRVVEGALAASIARAERGLGTPSLVLVDVNGFAGLNEAYGSDVGDAVLRSVGERLARTSRAVDTVGRLGGDEFAVVLESTGGPGAVAALRRLRDSLVGGWAAVGPVEDAAVTASLGITTYRPGDGVASLFARADAERYADKARS